MKQTIYHLLLSFVLSCTVQAQNSPIEIRDRRSLPADVYSALKKYSAILIGEVHGSNETPQFMEGLVNLWLAYGEKVILGLEINIDEQQQIDEFMRSGDFEIIKKMPFFNRDQQDGRSSAAMATLIKSCYKKENVKIVCLDAAYATVGKIIRDSIMADNALAAIHNNAGWKFISLTGNVHNKTDLQGFGYPMGYWLYNIKDGLSRQQINSIDVIWESGSCWNCVGPKVDCSVHAQGNYAYTLQGKTVYDNCLFADEHKLFTRVASASLPLNKQ